MTPIEFEGANAVLGAPAGLENEVAPLPVFRDGENCVSCWAMTDDERAIVAATGKVWLNVWFGGSQPPVSIMATCPLVRAEALTPQPDEDGNAE